MSTRAECTQEDIPLRRWTIRAALAKTDTADGGKGVRPPSHLPGDTHFVLWSPVFEKPLLKTPACLLAVQAGLAEPLAGSGPERVILFESFLAETIRRHVIG